MTAEALSAAEAAINADLPLTGVRVLDMTRMLPGNLCTLSLAMLGADVIKIEDTGAGDYQRIFGHQVDGAGACNHVVNRGKRSVMLDLKADADRAAFETLVRSSDVLVESFRPGTLDKLGFTLEHLHGLRPRLVVASLSGYGATGPLAQVAGHDINYLAFSGLLHRQGTREGAPALPPLPLADLVGGGLVPAMLVMAYLRKAESTGKGCWIDASMTDAMSLLPHVTLADVLAGADVPGRAATLNDGGLACYDSYAVRDGEIVVGALEEKFWGRVCDVVGGMDEFRRDHWRPEIQEPARRRLAEFFAPLTRAEVSELFAGADACVSPVQSYEEMLRSPHAQARGYVAEVPGGPMPVLSFPARVDGAPLPETRPAPRQGEHNSELLGDGSSC
ncbi:MAG TPA: CoA transferase [Pseudonocardia sp.]|jgi:crotonobetainyl-CoA:carnitine CoA-transferase CaiB-like acyl-CoA transferase|nr:CoA transferase [Pseudonocardia sp.]